MKQHDHLMDATRYLTMTAAEVLQVPPGPVRMRGEGRASHPQSWMGS